MTKKASAIFLTIAGVAMIFSWCLLQPATPSSQPNQKPFVFPIQTHDFHILPPQSHSDTTFTTTNSLPATLIIDHVNRSCGCTSVELSNSVIEPGHSLEVKCVLATGAPAGPMTSKIEITGRAGDVPVQISYELLASVENVLEFPEAPGLISLGSYSIGHTSAEREINVTRGKCPLAFDELEAVCDASVLSAKVEPTSRDSWKISFYVKDAGELGTIAYPVYFRFKRQGAILPETVEKQAYVEWKGPVMASPPSIIFTTPILGGSQKQVDISLRDPPSNADFPKITHVETTGSSVVASVTSDGRSVILDYTALNQVVYDRGAVIIDVMAGSRSYRLRVNYVGMIE